MTNEEIEQYVDSLLDDPKDETPMEIHDGDFIVRNDDEELEENTNVFGTNEEIKIPTMEEILGDMEKYSVVSPEHALVLDAVAKECRSNKKGFKIQDEQTEKLGSIKELLKDTKYSLVEDPNFLLYIPPREEISVIVTAHADIVSNIRKPFSNVKDDGYMHGTYDNAICNGALVTLAKEERLPKGVAFAFTADEETGRCNGAHGVLAFMRVHNIEPVCIALDVTADSYDDGMIATIENLSSKHKGKHLTDNDRAFIDSTLRLALDTEPDDVKTFTFVPLNKLAVSNAIPKTYYSSETGWYDEAEAYLDDGASAFSFCIPTDGPMHSDAGLTVRQPVYEGYLAALECQLRQITRDGLNLIPGLIDKKKVCAELSAEMVTAEAQIEKAERAAKAAKWGKYPSSWSSYDRYDGIPQGAFEGGQLHWSDLYPEYNWYDNDYNDGFGNIEFDPENDEFTEYYDSVMGELYDMAINGYTDGDDLQFTADALEMIPDDIKETFGDEGQLCDYLSELFENAMQYKEDIMEKD